jgi:YidC/Oxa1 family membrane protein insertase
MEKRFFVFLFLASLALLANAYVVNWLNPPPPPKPKVAAQKPADKEAAKPAEIAQADPDQPAAAVADEEKPQPQPQAEQEAVPTQWLTLGSVDPNSPYRMGVTLTNRGAAIERIEMSSQRLRDLEDETGYLGHLAATDADEKQGAVVHAVVDGTPAAEAGLKPGDVIVELDGQPVKEAIDLRTLLRRTRRGQQIAIVVKRDGQTQPAMTARLERRPIEVVRPEGTDPLSLLLTLDQLGAKTISKEIGATTRESESGNGALVTEVVEGSPAARAALRQGDVITAVDGGDIDTPAELTEMLKDIPAGTRLVLTVTREDRQLEVPLSMPSEIEGLNLRTGNWQVKSSDNQQVTFAWTLAEGIEIVKQFRLAKAEKESAGRDYHLMVKVELTNGGSDSKRVAYQLDGPNGLPIEGWWYANKISRTWSGVGVRDLAVQFEGNDPLLKPALSVTGADADWTFAKQSPLVFIGVDAQYFASAMVPQQTKSDTDWFSEVHSLRIGSVPERKDRTRLVNTSFRLVSQPTELQPGGTPISHEFVLFAGPKQPDLLELYGLRDLVYYGWFGWVARPMLAILHFFYELVGNYGIAIIMLTVLVRGCMFPLSRKQALSAQKMQELQPEIKKIADKYKNNMEARNKAQQELFRKHNYNPLGGCLLMFVQLPIFIGLYRSLMVDVELRQAPLIPGLDWCSNLAAPDMLFRWDSWMPEFLAGETGWLGPYFNLLPIFTIGLFIWQQKMFMPPPADEQAALQQKMMKYMMVFMGFMFFKVASGLCIYFIASSLWGIAERKLLPKVAGPQAASGDGAKKEAEPRKAVANVGGNGAAAREQRRKQRGK